MKIAAIVSVLLIAPASAFVPATPTSRQLSTSAAPSSSSLHVFGGGDKKEKASGPGMMDQLAMFKKAQEMAQKKRKLDDELTQMDFKGSSPDGKVTGTFKYVPISNPMDPNPDYEAVKFDFDDAFFASASPAELSTAVKAAITDGIDKTNLAVAEKYQTLQADLMEAFGGAKKQ